MRGKLLLSFLVCGLAFLTKDLWSDPWPPISQEPPDKPGGWWHRTKNMAVETVRMPGQVNWWVKCLSAVILVEGVALLGAIVMTTF